MLTKNKQFFFVGIGGAGMSGLAEVLHHQDFQVSGSDIANSDATAHLENLGISVYKGHDAARIKEVDVVVVSSAVRVDNVELAAARHHGIPILKRAEMLAELMQLKRGIAVSGSSGKTTATSLLAAIMHEAKLDPTFVIGAKVNSVAANAKLGGGEFLLVEADESDASFLYLQPEIAVVTNINPDHLYSYQQDFSKLKQAFLDFMHKLPEDGLAVLCVDDKNICEFLPNINRPFLTYAINNQADVRAVNIRSRKNSMQFVVKRAHKNELSVELNMLGEHNVLNALAAIAVATHLGLSDDAILQALKCFKGVVRRLNIIGEKCIANKVVLLVDDYGHHPKEVAATVHAMRQGWPGRKITMVFQPHRYTRTRDLFDEFVQVLQCADRLILLPIYPAHEEAIKGISSSDLADKIRSEKKFNLLVCEKKNLFATLKSILQENDILLMQGAGDIGLLVQQLEKEVLCG